MFWTSPQKKLEKKLQKLLAEAYQLSHTDRKKSDEKQAEAEQVAAELDALLKQKETK